MDEYSPEAIAEAMENVETMQRLTAAVLTTMREVLGEEPDRRVIAGALGSILGMITEDCENPEEVMKVFTGCSQIYRHGQLPN